MSKSTDGKFEIVFDRHDDDSYLGSDTDYIWWIVSTDTGDQLAQFSGSSYQRADRTSRNGIQSVAFSPDSTAVLATDHSGAVTTFELPASARTIDAGRAIELVWRDGRAERRARKRVIAMTKYGQPIHHPLVDEPEPDPETEK